MSADEMRRGPGRPRRIEPRPVVAHALSESDASEAPARLARSDRQDKDFRKRRTLEERFDRRTEIWSETRTKLSVPEHIRQKYRDSELRWVNIDGIRDHEMIVVRKWEPVEDDEGRTIRAPVGYQQNGAVLEAILCEYPKSHFREARDRRSQQLNRDLDRVISGAGSAPGGIEQTGAGYVPQGNYLKRGG